MQTLRRLFLKHKIIISIFLILSFSGTAFAGVGFDSQPSIGYPFTINLQWEALSDPDIRGYAVYYGNTSPPQSVIQVGPQTSCDIMVYAGQTYYFGVVSIDTLGNEDPMSEILRWYAVPSPTQGIYIERKVRKLWITY